MTDASASFDDWRALAAKELGGNDPDTLVWNTPEGLAVKPLYTAADLEGLAAVGQPGFEPFTRGVRATMYANRPWTIRQYAGFSTAEESCCQALSAFESSRQGNRAKLWFIGAVGVCGK